MPDINLFGNRGFQEDIPVPELVEEKENRMTEEKEAATKQKKTKQKKMKKSFLVQELGAVVLAVIVGALIWWYFVMKTTVRSEVTEYTPHEFLARPKADND